ncbi:N-acetyltransferase [filamentous cyanobacterium CCT1]|nr:N-acetyltransferase [filamentous cyanobacterium CCT1]PSN80360.1 N-acetyltransferase [filamentous cyanobacterium CCP4]
MRFSFRRLEKEHALSILRWRYLPPYDTYNFDADTTQEDLCYLIDPKNAFYAILNVHEELEGYYSFGADGQVPGGDYCTKALDIGMGMQPDLVGQGQGKHYAQAVVKYGVNQYRTQKCQVTIAEFNKRAQRVWEQVGLKQIGKFVKTGTEEEFVIMIYEV